MSHGLNSIEQLLPPFNRIKITSGVDRYGFSTVLAKRCRRRVVLRSFANWTHGWFWHDEPTVKLLSCSGLPRTVTIVVGNEKERTTLVEAGYKDVRIGGLPFAYVHCQNVSRNENALLAFPSHSAESERMTDDQAAYMDYLETLKHDFEFVYVCIYYLDMGGAMHKAALARGLRVIQGARPDDANSLLRMRTVLDSFGYVTSNAMGSHMLYALFAGCKFSFCGPMYSHGESVYLGGGNPHGHTTDYLHQLLELHSESYLRNRFGRFFVNTPKMGIEDLPFAEDAIGMRFIMPTDAIEDALGWSFEGQVRGYMSGVQRRLVRAIFANTPRI